MSYGIKCVTVCAYDWLLFVFCYIYIVYDMMYVFSYLNILRYIQVALSRRHYLLSSCAQQSLWCRHQGTPDGHIPLPKRQYQQVCYWQPMDRHNHPIIKRTRSKIHYYYLPLSCHKEFRVWWDWAAEMQLKNFTKNKLIFVFLFVAVSLDS